MSDNAEGDRAISALNGADLDGRALNVNEARPKTDRGSIFSESAPMTPPGRPSTKSTGTTPAGRFGGVG